MANNSININTREDYAVFVGAGEAAVDKEFVSGSVDEWVCVDPATLEHSHHLSRCYAQLPTDL